MAEATVAQREVACLVVAEGEVRWTRRARPGDGDVEVEPLAVGLDGTDEAVAKGEAGRPPEGRADLVLGHEALLRVVGTDDRVVPLVRRGCDRCGPCGRGLSDLCESGAYLEHGIEGLDGWYADRALARQEELVPVPAAVGLEAVLTEPLSISVKGLQHARAVRKARLGEDFDGGANALVVGLGSLGSLACLLLRDRGFEVAVVDRSPDEASRRFASLTGCDLLDAAPGRSRQVDLVLETPGSLPAIAEALRSLGPNGVLVTLGTPSGRKPREVPGDRLVRELVLENHTVLGSVNSNRGHFEEALRVLERWRVRRPAAVEALLAQRWRPEEGAAAVAAEASLKKVVVWDRA